jgi:hypothetical protein
MQNVGPCSIFSWRDWTGIAASVGCAIHCGAMPFVIAFLPTLGLSFLAHEAFHRWMAIVCFVIAIAAFIPSYRRHGRLIPGTIAAVGLVVITGAAWGMAGDCCAACVTAKATTVDAVECGTESCCEHCAASAESSKQEAVQQVGALSGLANPSFASATLPAGLAPWLTPLGGLLLVTAHVLNLRFGGQCSACTTLLCRTGDA